LQKAAGGISRRLFGFSCCTDQQTTGKQGVFLFSIVAVINRHFPGWIDPH